MGSSPQPAFLAPQTNDQSFEAVLLRLWNAAAEGLEFEEIIGLFCRVARQHFQLSGVFCWLLDGDELLGLGGDGLHSEEYRGLRQPLDADNYSAQAVRERRTILINDLAQRPDKIGRSVQVESLLVSPLIVAGRVIGAIVFVHNAQPDFFNEEITIKAKILAAQLGSLVESAKLTRASREERRRAEALMKCAQALHTKLDVHTVCAELTRTIVEVLGARAAVFVAAERGSFRTVSIVSSDLHLESDLHAHHDHGTCKFACEMALRAIERREPVKVRLEEVGYHPVENLSEGQMLVAPVFGRDLTGALLCYPPDKREFDDQEISLLRAVASFGSVAISNAELVARSNDQASEMQQLLAIASELSSADGLDRFMERFVIRAAEFLGFEGSCIALVEADGKCMVRWAADSRGGRPLRAQVPERVSEHVIVGKKVFWTDDVVKIDLHLPYKTTLQLKQVLVAPLVGSHGGSLGLLSVLNRRDGQGISPKDVRRAEALAAAVSAVLERTQNLVLAVQHQARAQALVSLALEVNSSIRLPELVNTLARRAASILGAKSAALALMRGSTLEIVDLQTGVTDDKNLLRRLTTGLSDLLARCESATCNGPAADMLGTALAEAIGWNDLAVARLVGADGEVIGLLCLANMPAPISDSEQAVLQAIAAHASVALDNSRLFTRIAQSNTQWVEIFDAISDFIIVHDENNRVLRTNRSMADFIGTHPQSLVGVDMRTLMALAQEPGPEPCPFCRYAVEEFIHPVLERTYLVSTSRILGSLNDGHQTIHVLKDITDRREAERRYRELFDNIQEGLFFSTPDGRFVEVNDALVRMLGYDSREELLQVDIANALYTGKDRRRIFQDSVESIGVLRNFEETLRRKDGTLIHTLQNAFAVRDAQGMVIQYRGLMLDITELKRFQAELQRQRDFNAGILNNTQSLIVVADTAGLIAFANRRCYEICGSGELVGTPLAGLFVPARRDVILDALQRTITGDQVDNLEMTVLRGHETVGQFSVNLSPVRDEQGQVNSVVAVMTDITDAAILQAKLMHTEKLAAVGQLVSGVAHEVNNPLTAILGFADLLREQDDVPDNAKRDLGIIVQEAQRTKQIVQNLLSFARQTPSQRHPVQLVPLLRRTLQLRAYDFANNGVKAVEKFSDTIPDVIADPHQLQQVFLNIVNNAYDAIRETDSPGEIEIATSVRNGHVEIVFADTGNGITAPERIFDPFFTTKEVGKGTGLGLSICYGIIRDHGGEITCANRTDTRGAIFTIRLPFAKAAAASAAGKGN